MTRTAAGLAAAIALTACKPSPEKAEERRKAELLAIAEDITKQRLKDPSSAEFRGLRVAKNGAVVCGEVNSKNSFGAFTGFRRVAIVKNLVAIEGETMTLSEFSEVWHVSCN